MKMTLAKLAETIDAELIGEGSTEVSGCAPIDSAGPDQISFLANAKYARYLSTTRAAAVIVGPTVTREADTPLLVATDPYFAFRAAMIALHGFRQHPHPFDAPTGATRSANAAIHPDAEVADDAVIHPFVTIEAGASVGSRSILYPGVFVGPEATVGEDCLLYPGVAIYDRCRIGDRVTLHANCVVGQDGFGYATHDGVHHKIPQHGIVVIEDDVELGGGCAIERAAMGETRIGAGTKFADLISIGHGTRVGRHCLFVSLVGIAGSVEVGDYVALGGQVGVSGHLKIGHGVQAAGKAAIVADVPDGMRVGGIPAVEFNKAKRNVLISSDMGSLVQRLKKLEQRLAELESQPD